MVYFVDLLDGVMSEEEVNVRIMITYTNFSEADVPTLNTKVFHAVQSKFPQITRVLATTCNKW